MKPLAEFGLCCILAQCAFASHQGGVVVSNGHPGSSTAGHNPAHVRGSARTFGHGLYGGYGYGFGGFYGDYSNEAPDYGYAPPAAPAGSNVTIVYPPAAPAAPVHSVIHEYTQPEDYGTVAPAGDGAPVLYLIAFRDGNIHAAMTYWIEDGTLHYLDTNHKEQRAPVSSIDRELSARLNRERHVPFNIQ